MMRWFLILMVLFSAKSFAQVSAFDYIEMATVKLQNGQATKAKKIYKTALEEHPNDPDLHYNYARILKRLGDIDEAIEHYNTTIALDSLFAFAYNNLGIALKDTGNIKLAIENYNKAISINNKYPNPYINRGAVKLAYNNENGALQDFQTALDLSIGFMKDVHWRGKPNSIDESVPNSIKVQSFTIIESNNIIPLIYHNMGLAHNQLGNVDKACYYWVKATGLGHTKSEQNSKAYCR